MCECNPVNPRLAAVEVPHHASHLRDVPCGHDPEAFVFEAGVFFAQQPEQRRGVKPGEQEHGREDEQGSAHQQEVKAGQSFRVLAAGESRCKYVAERHGEDGKEHGDAAQGSDVRDAGGIAGEGEDEERDLALEAEEHSVWEGLHRKLE